MLDHLVGRLAQAGRHVNRERGVHHLRDRDSVTFLLLAEGEQVQSADHAQRPPRSIHDKDRAPTCLGHRPGSGGDRCLIPTDEHRVGHHIGNRLSLDWGRLRQTGDEIRDRDHAYRLSTVNNQQPVNFFLAHTLCRLIDRRVGLNRVHRSGHQFASGHRPHGLQALRLARQPFPGQ